MRREVVEKETETLNFQESHGKAHLGISVADLSFSTSVCLSVCATVSVNVEDNRTFLFLPQSMSVPEQAEEAKGGVR
mgnify:CR=1 FL=1